MLQTLHDLADRLVDDVFTVFVFDDTDQSIDFKRVSKVFLSFELPLRNKVIPHCCFNINQLDNSLNFFILGNGRLMVLALE
jgi:hypothetical protein